MNLTLSHLSGHTSLKYQVKSHTNIKCNLNTYPFLHMAVMRYKGYVTYGIRARVEKLGPIGLKMLPHALFN